MLSLREANARGMPNRDRAESSEYYSAFFRGGPLRCFEDVKFLAAGKTFVPPCNWVFAHESPAHNDAFTVCGGVRLNIAT
jgi:hypothetical protein